MAETAKHAISQIGDKISSMANGAADKASSSNTTHSVGQYLARYLLHIGVEDMFVVPGDYNLVLLDELIKPVQVNASDAAERQLNMYCNCNELNCGYAGDGYARCQGVSAIVVTHSVGSLSCINAVAGAFAEHSPMIVISGGLNSNAQCQGEIIHHSLTERENKRYDYVRAMYEHVTVAAVTISRPADAPNLIHYAISTALRESRPVLIDIACNICNLPISLVKNTPPAILPNATKLRQLYGDQDTIAAAVKHATEVINAAKSPVLIAGQHLKPYTCWNHSPGTPDNNAFLDVVNKGQYGFATMLDAKTVISETHSNYMGIYLVDASTVPGQRGSNDHSKGNALRDVVTKSDLTVYVGCVLSDYATAGHTSNIDPEHYIMVYRTYVKVLGTTYHDVPIYDFLQALAAHNELKPNGHSLKLYEELCKTADNGWKSTTGKQDEEMENKLKRFSLTTDPSAPITNNSLQYELQEFVERHTQLPLHIVVETGDAWFTAQKLLLPPPHTFDIQLQYGSIGWSVGCVLGAAVATIGKQRVMGIIGDGSFQLSAQEISTMIRYDLNPIIVLLNNHDYVIEEEIHPGPYNRINNWRYSQLPQVFSQGVYGKGIKRQPVSFNCSTRQELQATLKATHEQHRDQFVLIEVQLDPKDSNIELGVWAKPVSANSLRKPHAPNEFLQIKPHQQPEK